MIGEENYSLVYGSIVVVLNSEYLQTLSASKHTVEIVFTNGSVSTNMTVLGSGANAAGDNDNGAPGWAIALIVICCVIILALAGFAVYLFIIRKSNSIDLTDNKKI